MSQPKSESAQLSAPEQAISAPAEEQLFAGGESRSSVDYMLRTAQQGAIQLSSMADQKASVVLGATFVMSTIVVGDGSTAMSVPRIMLAVTALGSGALAGLALMPAGKSKSKSTNPLFFQGIAEMTPEEHHQRLMEISQSDDQVYDAIVTDLYWASATLGRRKYPLLRRSYQFLLAGMLATLVATVALNWQF